MWKDEIVDEVRQARERYIAEHHGDIDEIYRDIKRKEQSSERTVVCFPSKQPSRNTDENVDAA